MKKINLIGFLALISLWLFTTNCAQNNQPVKGDIGDVILRNADNYFSLDLKNYPKHDKSLPIGIFDSGTGGLAVLDVILNYDRHDNASRRFIAAGDGIRDFKNEYFIYLGDQANMPYGNYSRENNIPLLKEHIIKNVHFLMDNKYYPDPDATAYKTDKESVKAIVIACNTATAYGKSDIEKFLSRAKLNMKVIGVIDAGVKGALSIFKKSESGSIGIMATAGTVSSQGYVKTIRTQLKKRNYNGVIDIFQQAGIGLAGAIDGSDDYISPAATKPRAEYKGPSENNPDAAIDLTILDRYGFDWNGNKMLYEGDRKHPQNIQINSVENYIAYHVVSLLEKIRKAGNSKPLKAIILGCTHYPFFTDVFEQNLTRLYNYRENGKYIYRPFMAKKVALIDPSLNTAKELYAYLDSLKLFNSADLSKSEFYISVPNKLNRNVRLDSMGNFTYKYKYGRKAGFIQQYVKRVPFSKKTISPDIADRLRKKIPFTFELIKEFNRSNPKMRAIPASEKF
ncbi:MAG: Asp/Glu/hydantoin racemase [Calditrichaeota bacterium]|nr:Asp/Glu/hydantoin racemase [Calditrichota bacterium]